MTLYVEYLCLGAPNYFKIPLPVYENFVHANLSSLLVNFSKIRSNKFDQNKFDENEEEDEQFEMLLDELGVRSVIGSDDQVLKGAADYRFHK